jgi:hypothetical protein
MANNGIVLGRVIMNYQSHGKEVPHPKFDRLNISLLIGKF